MTYKFFGRLMGALLLLSIALALTACGTSTTTPVWKYQTVLIAIPDSLLPPCPVTPPPATAKYQAATPMDREGMQTDAYTAQTKNIGTCNQEISRAKNWTAQQKALYPDAIMSDSASAPQAASAPQTSQ